MKNAALTIAHGVRAAAFSVCMALVFIVGIGTVRIIDALTGARRMHPKRTGSSWETSYMGRAPDRMY